MGNRLCLAGAASAVGLWVTSPAAAAEAGTGVAPSERCNTATLQSIAPSDTTVAFAAREQGGCRATGYVTTQNPGPNKVLFMLTLPDAFNGRYVYLGVGGAAGQLPTASPSLLAKGYALAGSDGGSGAKSGSDFSFMNDPAKAADFMGRGVQVTAAATQQITRAYYGRQELRRYISGCSGGGQMGLTNARKFGAQNFDGFLVGATPWPVTAYMPHIYRIGRQLQTRPDGWIPPDLMKKAHAAILAAYDKTDGVEDGIIYDQRNFTFDTGILRGVGFTPAQIETFELIRQPYKYTSPFLKGTVLHPGYAITDVSGWSSFLLGTKAPPWGSTATSSAGQLVAGGAPFIHTMADSRTRSDNPTLDYWSIRPMPELIKVAARSGAEMRYEDPMDFGALAGSGAKMIVYHGVNDQAMSYLETVGGYELLLQRFPEGRNWVRTFTIPGMLHCAGGSGPTNSPDRLLEALVAWVEQGQAPDTVAAERFTPAKGLERSFRLCAEPNRAVLKAAGLDPASADNWECRAPAASVSARS